MGSDSYDYERLNGMQWTGCDKPDVVKCLQQLLTMDTKRKRGTKCTRN